MTEAETNTDTAAAAATGAVAGERKRRMARFRNLLVHMYWKVDYEKVHEVIHHSLEELRLFGRTIARLL